MTENKVAVDVFQDSKNDPASRVNQETPETNQQPADQPEAKTPSSTKKGINSTTTQVVSAQDNDSNLLVASAPWIAAGGVAIVILIALFSILRKLNKKA